MNPQMTFETLRLNRTVTSPLSSELNIRPRLKRQAKAIYNALRKGPLYTNDLRAMACQYNARIKELRDWLREFDLTIDCTKRQTDGNNRYELRPFYGSRYQAELMARQKK